MPTKFLATILVALSVITVPVAIFAPAAASAQTTAPGAVGSNACLRLAEPTQVLCNGRVGRIGTNATAVNPVCPKQTQRNVVACDGVYYAVSFGESTQTPPTHPQALTDGRGHSMVCTRPLTPVELRRLHYWSDDFDQVMNTDGSVDCNWLRPAHGGGLFGSFAHALGVAQGYTQACIEFWRQYGGNLVCPYLNGGIGYGSSGYDGYSQSYYGNGYQNYSAPPFSPGNCQPGQYCGQGDSYTPTSPTISGTYQPGNPPFSPGNCQPGQYCGQGDSVPPATQPVVVPRPNTNVRYSRGNCRTGEYCP